MRQRDEALFHRYDLGGVLDNARKAVAKEIADLRDEVVLNTPIEVLVDRLEDDLKIAPIVLHEDRQFLEDPRETDIQVFDPWDRAMVAARGYRIVRRIPFDGDANLFQCKPSTFTFSPPHARVEHGTVTFTLETQELDPAALKIHFDRELSTLKQWVGWVNGGVNGFNGSVRGMVEQAIAARQAERKKAKDVLAALGVPVKGAAEAPRTYSVPMPPRSAPPPMPAAVPVKPLVPQMAQEHYEFILRTIHNVAKSMERTPDSFATLGEEQIRDHLLSHLNGHYPGKATGETFNVSGKTDILLRHENQNLFIAECKVWEGQAAFKEAIDQLSRYLGWRDRKAALFVFNRQKDTSQVLQRIRETVTAHPGYKRELASPLGEGTFRFILKQPTDETAELLTAVLVFDVSPRGVARGRRKRAASRAT